MKTRTIWQRIGGGADWRIWFGLGATVVWTSGILWYVMNISGITVETSSMDVVGNFLEGAFAPLAFLWLVLGLFIQQQELAKNTDVLRQTSLQSEKQTRAIAATEMNARQGTFFTIAESVRQQLGGIAGMLFISSMGPPGNGKFDRQAVADLWSQLSAGDMEIFSRQFLILDPEEEGGYPELFYGTEIRIRHTLNFRHTFDRMLRLAKNCDVEGIIEDSLRQSGHGLLFDRMVNNAPGKFETITDPPANTDSATV